MNKTFLQPGPLLSQQCAVLAIGIVGLLTSNLLRSGKAVTMLKENPNKHNINWQVLHNLSCQLNVNTDENMKETDDLVQL